MEKKFKEMKLFYAHPHWIIAKGPEDCLTLARDELDLDEGELNDLVITEVPEEKMRTLKYYIDHENSDEWITFSEKFKKSLKVNSTNSRIMATDLSCL